MTDTPEERANKRIERMKDARQIQDNKLYKEIIFRLKSDKARIISECPTTAKTDDVAELRDAVRYLQIVNEIERKFAQAVSKGEESVNWLQKINQKLGKHA